MFLLQLLQLLLLAALFSANSGQVVDDPFKLRINEVKLGTTIPFVELKKNIPVSILAGGLDKLNGYGMMTMQLQKSYVKKKDPINFLKLKGYIDLKSATMAKYHEFGVVDMHEVQGTWKNLHHLNVPKPNWRITGYATDVFNVEEDNLLVIFLTYSPNKNLLDETFFPASNQESKKQLMQFLKSHSIDSIVIRGRNGPESMELMQKVLNIGAQEYLPNTNMDWMSIQKCRSLEEPHKYYNFKFGHKTPGKQLDFSL